MINEHSSTQANTSTSANMQYGYPTNRFDLMNMSPMQNPNDLYSYYPTSLYQPFGTFDEHNQWSPTDTSNTILTSGPLQYHPQMYPPSGVDISRNLFDYSHHTYSPYHPVFTPSTGDMSWNPHNLSLQQQQPIPLISNKTSSVYDEYPSNSGGGGGDVGNMLAQHMNSINLGNNDTNNLNILSSKEQQQQYQLNSSNFSLTRPSGPKSYASVVSSDIINSISNKSTPSISNSTIYSTSNDSSNAQQTRHNRYQQQSSVNGNLLNWTNKNSERSLNTKLSRTDNNNQYNPKDFNLNPKGARFFVIKSYSEDDVHRSIKYNIWCSTEHGNKRLDAAFREREGKGPIYLFFSVNASGHFCGMAEMVSPLDYEHQTDVWHMSNKWQGKFEVKWIYVKDVPNQQFRNIRLENNENKPVTNSRDTQEIPYEKGKLMLKTLHMYRHKTSIFDDFQYYESKQAEEITTKEPSNQDLDNDNNNNNNNYLQRRQGTSNRTPRTGQLNQKQNDNNDEE